MTVIVIVIATGTQSISVVDTTAPRVRAALVGLPPLAVSASQITLTAKQTLQLLFSLLEIAKLGLGAFKLPMKSPLTFDLGFGFVNQKSTADEALAQMTSLVNGNPSASLDSLFGSNGAQLLSSAGFDMAALRQFLNSATNSKPGSGSGSGSSGGGGATLPGGVFGGSPIGSPLLKVTVPDGNNNNDLVFDQFLRSGGTTGCLCAVLPVNHC